MNCSVLTKLNYKIVFDKSRTASIILDISGNIIDANEAVLNFLNYDYDVLLNKNINYIIPLLSCNNLYKQDNVYNNVIIKTKDAQAKICELYTCCLDSKNESYLLEIVEVKDNILCFIESLKGNFEHYGSGIFIKDFNGRYIYTNKKFQLYFHKKLSDIKGHNDYELFDEDKASIFTKNDDIIRRKKVCTNSLEKIMIEGEFKYFEIEKSVLIVNEKPVGICGIVIDVTENFRVDNELMIKNEQLSILYNINKISKDFKLKVYINNLSNYLQNLLNINTVSIYLVDYDTGDYNYYCSTGLNDSYTLNKNITKTNKNYISRIISNNGITLKKISQNEYLDDIVHLKDEGIRYIASYPLLSNNSCIGIINFGSRSQDYSYEWDDDFIRAICNSSAMIISGISVYNRMKNNLIEEKVENKRLNLFLETTNDYICIIESDGKIIKANKHMKQEFGLKGLELFNVNFCGMLHPDDKKRIKSKDYLINNNGVNSELRLRVKNLKGEYKLVDWYINYLADDDIFICSGRDITRKIKLEEKENEIKNMKALDKIKNEFLSTVSHELRTPVTVMYGLIQLLEENFKGLNIKSNKTIEYVNRIKKNTSRLIRLINNVIDITNYNANSLELNRKYVNITILMRTITESLKQYLNIFKLDIECISYVDNEFAYLDLEKFKKVVMNLISNSIKYKSTKRKLKIYIIINKVNDGNIEIRFKDNGIGIKKDDTQFLFNKCKQLDSTMTRRAEGIGIGLHFIKMILDMHGATITYNHKVEVGSEFIIRLNSLKLNCNKLDKNNEKIISTKTELYNYSIDFEDICTEFSDIV